MSSSLLLEQCPAYLVLLIWIIFVMGRKLLLYGVLPPGFVQYCSQHSCVVAVKLFSIRLVSVHVTQYRHNRCLKKTAFYFIGQV